MMAHCRCRRLRRGTSDFGEVGLWSLHLAVVYDGKSGSVLCWAHALSVSYSGDMWTMLTDVPDEPKAVMQI